MSEDNKKNTHGGKRREGRTKTNKTFGIDNDLIPFLKEMKNVAKFVNEAIREKLARYIPPKP